MFNEIEYSNKLKEALATILTPKKINVLEIGK
jgi:hypothetical protein